MSSGYIFLHIWTAVRQGITGYSLEAAQLACAAASLMRTGTPNRRTVSRVEIAAWSRLLRTTTSAKLLPSSWTSGSASISSCLCSCNARARRGLHGTPLSVTQPAQSPHGIAPTRAGTRSSWTSRQLAIPSQRHTARRALQMLVALQLSGRGISAHQRAVCGCI